MRLYLIGAGVIARTHVAAARHIGEDVEVHAADPVPAVRDSFAAEFPDTTLYATSEEMLDAPAREDDVVIVATPPAAHLGPAVAALRGGRHVLCEKPLVLDAAEAQELLRASAETGRMLGSCSTRFRGLPHTETVKQAMASGVLGDVYAVTFTTRWPRSRAGIEYQPSSRWFLDRSRSGGGVLMDLGPYDVSTLFDLFDPVRVDVRDAWLERAITAADPADVVFDVESDVGAALRLTLSDGRSLPVAFGRATGTHATETAHGEIVGTDGALHWAPFDSQAPVFLRTDGDGAIVESELEPLPREPLSIFDRPLVEFVHALRGRPSRAALGAVAVAEFLVLQAIYAAAATGEPQVVEVPR